MGRPLPADGFSQAADAPAATVAEADQVRYEAGLVELLYRQFGAIFFGNALVLGFSVWLLRDYVPTLRLIGWALVVLAVNLARRALVQAYERAPDRLSRPRRWARYYTFGAAMSGIVWGSVGVLFFNENNMTVTAYLCIVVAGMAGGSIATYGSWRPAYLMFALPVALPFAARTLWEGGLVYTELGALCLFVLVLNLSFFSKIHATLCETVRLRLENQALVGELTIQKDNAEAATRVKARLLAAASHDLRQPVHSLGLFLGTLEELGRRPVLQPADVGRIAVSMQRALGALSGLLGALLDLSRLDAGTVEPKPAPLALEDLLDTLHSQFAGPARAQGLRFASVPSRLWVETDRGLLLQVLSNLCTNALRYNRRGGRVLVGCRRGAGRRVTIQVLDTGIGIAPEEQPRVFGEFYQVAGAGRGREQGLGLGLAIVQRTARLLGGELTLRSVPGRGSCFALTLPTRPAPAPAIVDAPHLEPLPASGAGRTVLIVDDDEQVLEALAMTLRVWGHTVHAAADAASARLLARTHAAAIELVLADYRLGSETTGPVVVRELLAIFGRPVPVTIVTGDTAPAVLTHILGDGHRLLHKPVDVGELRQLIEHLDVPLNPGLSVRARAGG